MAAFATSDWATMLSTVKDSSWSTALPVSNVTPRRITGVRSGVNRITQPKASTREPGGVPGHLSLLSSTPSPSESLKRWHPVLSTSVPGGVFGHLSMPSGTPSLSESRGQPAGSTVAPVGIDQCPNTPTGATVEPAGCPLDSDKDGVPDGIDKCPNTPPGTEVDSTGCQRFKDSDGDGVDDTKDKCPGTPPGSRVDAFGCVILFTPERTPVILRGVTFETGRAVLQLESFTVLNIVAQSLVANAAIRIEIAGYTDGTGSAATNLRLSQARAEVVRAYLVSRGVSPTRMIARGYGASNPIAVNSTPEGRAQNRRVELHQLP